MTSFGIPYSVSELRLVAQRIGDVYYRDLMEWAADTIETPRNRPRAYLVTLEIGGFEGGFVESEPVERQTTVRVHAYTADDALAQARLDSPGWRTLKVRPEAS